MDDSRATMERLPSKPHRLALTSDRTLVCDVAHFAKQIPLFPVERSFDLAELAARRTATKRRIAWSILFLKAYALVAADHLALRRAYVAWPWPHFVQWPDSIAMLAISRHEQGLNRLFWAAFSRPHSRRLVDLNGHLRWYQTQPIEVAFQKQLQFSRLPLPLRRLVWWWNLNVTASKRAARLGTFSVSSLAGQGALNRGHPTVLTSSLTYGPLDEHGRSLVTLLCDHRVLDGLEAAAVLSDLQAVLRTEICQELSALAVRQAA
jgi:hypothetical protein